MTLHPNENVLALAEAYYTAIGKKDIASAEMYLDPNIEFISPFASLHGKASMIEALNAFFNAFQNLTIRAKFSSGNQVMLAYNLDCPAPIGNFRSAALMTFKNGLITKAELFFDTRPFQS